jgi:hypothetical protein
MRESAIEAERPQLNPLDSALALTCHRAAEPLDTAGESRTRQRRNGLCCRAVEQVSMVCLLRGRPDGLRCDNSEHLYISQGL